MVNNFDYNQRGFCFEPFTNFNLKSFAERDMVDVIGTIISISQPIPFEYLGKGKMRKTVILQDIEGAQLECCFFDDWINKLDAVSNHQNESLTPVVMILQLASVKYFNKKPSINPAVFSTKLYIDEDLPEIHAFRKRYQEVDGYDATKTAISVYTPVKKEDTPEEFFAGGIKKMVGCIRESAWEYDCIVYGKVHKIHREYGWTYIGCKRCGRIAKPFEEDEDDSSSKKQVHSSKTEKAKPQFWTCKVHKKITAVGPKYKVIVRVIDDTGSASLLLFDDMINTLVDIPCYKLKDQYGPGAEDTILTKILFLGQISTINKTVSSPLVSTSVLTQSNVINTPEISKSVQPKRGRGRPRKIPVSMNPTSLDVALQSFQPSVRKQSNCIGSIHNNHFVTSSHVEQPNVINTPEISKSVPFKRGRGRPRKNPVITNHTSPDVLLQTSHASVPKPFNTNKSIPNQNDSPNLVSSNKRKYNLHNQNNENANPLKNKFNDAKSSAISNKHLTAVGKRAPLSDITSSTTSMINESISTFDVTTPFVSQQTNVTITPENSNSVVTHRGRGRPRTTPLTTNSSDQTKPKTRPGPGRGRKKTGAASSDNNLAASSDNNLDTPNITNAIPTNEDTYSRGLSDENPRSRFQNKTPIPFDIGSINHVDEQTSTIPNPTSTLEDRAHIKGKSIATENDIISSDEDTEDEHGYIDRICGISKDR
ncbi:replication protein A 70 kDa DNA-binding subunit C [Artemisia annua]|uniref:Replication protein A 70 kDa DNA-binding subunit C n=1 Tax=Artemisia annua TaxID=35608 RepID=A0A2U1PF79_ARTAN|nr:replication protein A 70 kDa DNA-binding subunit C [Artemisia annua]